MKMTLNEFIDCEDNNYYGIYITKNEILKIYEEDKNKCFEYISSIADMLTTPLCYHSNIFLKENYEKDYLKFDNFILNIKNKKNIKGITLIATREGLNICQNKI